MQVINLAVCFLLQGSMLAAGLFSGGGANPRGVTQAAVVSQALASGIPHASAAAMLAASGQNHPGGPTSGPAGDAATAAAMMAAGMMRGYVVLMLTPYGLLDYMLGNTPS